jgi:flagellar basal body-associated protein FliL
MHNWFTNMFGLIFLSPLLTVGTITSASAGSVDPEQTRFGLRGNEKVQRRLATWTQLGSRISGTDYAEWSGSSVVLSGDGLRVAIGAPGNDNTGTNAGCVRVYRYASSAWSQMGSNICGSVNSGEFGTSLSFNYDGTVLAVGAPFASSGKVYIYEESGGSWSQATTAVGVSSNDMYGMSVSFNGAGTVLAVGAPGYDHFQSDTGRAYIYTYGTSTLTPVITLTGASASDNFANSVSLNSAGNILAVGIPGVDGGGTDRGEVKVYQNSGSWAQLGSSIAGTTSNEFFGKYLSISGDGLRVAVAAPAMYSSSSLAGRVAVYEYSGSAWSKLGADMSGDQVGNMFGRSVALSSDGKRVVIGETYYSSGGFCGTQNGRTNIYDYSGSIWSSGGSTNGDCSEDSYGYSSAINCDGTVIVTGAANGLSNNQGYVYAFSVTSGDSTCVSSSSPTRAPTAAPTLSPSISFNPTSAPTLAPTFAPSVSFRPTFAPTAPPSRAPTPMPTRAPTVAPSVSPNPTTSPTRSPTRIPTTKPTLFPTMNIMKEPSGNSSDGSSTSSSTIIIAVVVGVVILLVFVCVLLCFCSKRSASSRARVHDAVIVPLQQPVVAPQTQTQQQHHVQNASGPRDVVLCFNRGCDSLERNIYERVELVDQALRSHNLSTWCRDKPIDELMMVRTVDYKMIFLTVCRYIIVLYRLP